MRPETPSGKAGSSALKNLGESGSFAMLSVLGGDVRALMSLMLSSREGKVKKSFTEEFYMILQHLSPFDSFLHWQAG